MLCQNIADSLKQTLQFKLKKLYDAIIIIAFCILCKPASFQQFDIALFTENTVIKVDCHITSIY